MAVSSGTEQKYYELNLRRLGGDADDTKATGLRTMYKLEMLDRILRKEFTVTEVRDVERVRGLIHPKKVLVSEVRKSYGQTLRYMYLYEAPYRSAGGEMDRALYEFFSGEYVGTLFSHPTEPETILLVREPTVFLVTKVDFDYALAAYREKVDQYRKNHLLTPKDDHIREYRCRTISKENFANAVRRLESVEGLMKKLIPAFLKALDKAVLTAAEEDANKRALWQAQVSNKARQTEDNLDWLDERMGGRRR